MGAGSSSYRPKAIYLDIDGRIQKVVFSKYCNSSDIMDLFCIATGLPRNTTISLLTTDDAMVSIDPTMPTNSERTPYKSLYSPDVTSSVNMEVGVYPAAQDAEHEISRWSWTTQTSRPPEK